MHSCSLSLLPFAQLELQRWRAVVVPALEREGGSGWAAQSWCSPPEESSVDCNVSEHGQSSHEKSCRCLCHQILYQVSNPPSFMWCSTSLLLCSSNPCPALLALGRGCLFIFEQRNTPGKTRLGEDSSSGLLRRAPVFPADHASWDLWCIPITVGPCNARCWCKGLLFHHVLLM